MQGTVATVKDIHTLTPGNCRRLALPGGRHFAGMLKDHKVLTPAESGQVLFKWTLASQSPKPSAAPWTDFYCLPGD